MTSTLAEKLCEKGCPTRREPAKSDREATRGEFGASGPIQRQGSRSVYSIDTRVLAKAHRSRCRRPILDERRAVGVLRCVGRLQTVDPLRRYRTGRYLSRIPVKALTRAAAHRAVIKSHGRTLEQPMAWRHA